MKNRAHDLDGYDFAVSETILFDTNVWLYLFPAPSGHASPFAKQYSAALKKMLVSGVLLAMDVLILSEYVNRYCRIEYEALYASSYGTFKTFRCSPDFISVGRGASIFARKILDLCSRHDYPFSSIEINQVLADFESGTCDLNDALAETCRVNGWKLVTNDSDLTIGGIEVLTTNPKLLAACA